jgi:hypothetical protein
MIKLKSLLNEQTSADVIKNDKKLIQSLIQQNSTKSILTYNGSDYFAIAMPEEIGNPKITVTIYKFIYRELNGGNYDMGGLILIPLMFPWQVSTGTIDTKSGTWESYDANRPQTSTITTHNLRGRKGIDSVSGYMNDAYNQLNVLRGGKSEYINIPSSLKSWEQFVMSGVDKYSDKFPVISKNIYWDDIQPKLTGFAKLATSKIPVLPNTNK